MIDSYLLQKKQLEDLNEKTKRLSEENQALRLQIETFEKKRFHIKRKIKSTRFYKVYRKLKDRIPKKESNIHSPSRKLEFNYDYMLSSYEYRFLKYKKARNNGYKINIQRISTPYAQNLVSIVLPVYNGDDYVEASIKSVLSQTYKNFELIIVDDGSTDRTPEIVDSCAEKDRRIKVIHQENRKLPRTLSRGFREARGELFTWTSADNIMHPQFLEKFVGEMKKYNHTGMIYGNQEQMPGAVAEAGVFRGEFAKEINFYFSDRPLYLFDTFDGFNRDDIKCEQETSLVTANYMKNLSEKTVYDKMPNKERVTICKGYFPETAIALNLDIPFCFVNLDMDLYKPTYEGLTYFYPRMCTGGCILIHDYFAGAYPNVKRAIKDYEQQKKILLAKLPIGDDISMAIIKI